MRASHCGIQTFHRARVGTCHEQKIRVASRLRGGAYSRGHLLKRDQLFASKVSATLWKSLVLQMHTRQPRPFEGVDGARDILRPAKSRVRIRQRRNAHRVSNITGQLRDLRECQQADVRHARRGIGEPGATDINRRKARALHQPRSRGVKCARHHHAALLHGAAKQRRFTDRFHFLD